MFRTKTEMAYKMSIWALMALGCGVFWVGFIWLLFAHPDVIVRGFIGLGLLAVAANLWRGASTMWSRVVAGVLSALVGYVSLSILGVW